MSRENTMPIEEAIRRSKKWWQQLKLFSAEELTELLLKFVRMSDKKKQQKTIEEIRKVLLKIGPKGLV